MRVLRPTHPMNPIFVDRGIYTDRTLDSYLIDAVTAKPDGLALVDAEHRLTWSELDTRAHAHARQLRSLGVGAHDVAMAILPNWWEAVAGMHAFLKLGAVTNPVVPIYRDAELGFILRQARPRVVVTPHRFRRYDYVEMFERLIPELDEPPAVVVVRPEGPLPPGFVEFDATQAGPPIESRAQPSDICMLMYTSGTTSDPKGVLHNHQTLDVSTRGMTTRAELGPEDTIFMPSPVTHITGYLLAVLTPALLGAPCIMQDIWDPQRAQQLIETEGCRYSGGATPFLRELLEVYQGRDCALRAFLCGGADVPAELIKAAARELDVWSARAYGSSEVPAYVMGGPAYDAHIRAETDGVPLLDGSDARLNEAVDGVGELLLRAPQMFLGYLDPELNADSFTADGFFHSGDLGEIGPQGEVTIRGRKKDIILRGGENISAKQVEDALFLHPAVRAVAVVAMPDPVMVERGCAFVVPDGEPPTLSQLTGLLNDQGLAKQKWPERLEIVDELPSTPSGKVQKFKLRERIREILKREGTH